MARRDPIRKCIGCGVRKSKFELLRIVNNNEQILIDPEGKIPGRGAYLCPSQDCIEKARKKNRLAKALKTSISDEIYNKLMEEIGNV